MGDDETIAAAPETAAEEEAEGDPALKLPTLLPPGLPPRLPPADVEEEVRINGSLPLPSPPIIILRSGVVDEVSATPTAPAAPAPAPALAPAAVAVAAAAAAAASFFNLVSSTNISRKRINAADLSADNASSFNLSAASCLSSLAIFSCTVTLRRLRGP